MDKMDFSSIAILIRKYMNSQICNSNEDFLYRLFGTYAESRDIAEFDKSLVSRWINGRVAVSTDIGVFYFSRNNMKKFEEDIKNNILTTITDCNMLVKKVKDLCLNDNSISKEKKTELLKGQSFDSDDSKAKFLATMIYYGIIRDFTPRTPDTEKRIKSGMLSPSAKDYIVNVSIPQPCKYFYGRDKEIDEIHNILTDKGNVFIQGISGIGKSELAKAYAKRYKNEYTNVIFIRYTGNLKQDILNIDFISDLKGESEEQLFSRREEFFKALRSDSLVIIDNFNTTASQEEFLPKIMEYGCRIIFTTCSRFDDYSFINVEEISNLDDLLKIMESHFPKAAEIHDFSKKIIEIVHRHTLAVELASKLLNYGVLSPIGLLEKLKEQNVALDSSDTINIRKDGRTYKSTYYGHIEIMYSAYRLTDEEKLVIRNLSLIARGEIDSRIFASWLKLKDMKVINSLIEKGLVNLNEYNVISMHPILQEITISKHIPSVENCKALLGNIQNVCLDHRVEFDGRRRLFGYIESIVHNIRNDESGYYIRFLIDAFAYMSKYDYSYGMKIIFDKLSVILEDQSVGSKIDRAIFKDYSTVFIDDLDKAIEVEKDAINSLGRIDTENALAASNMYNNLGTLYSRRGDLKNAGYWINQSLSINEGFDLSGYHDTIVQIYNCSVILVNGGRYKEAIKTLKKLETDMRFHNLSGIKEFADVLDFLGDLLLMHNIAQEAKDKYLSALNIYMSIYKDEQEKMIELQRSFKDRIIMCDEIIAGRARMEQKK